MIIGIQDEILRINSLGLLEKLLADKTTKTNILWATDAYDDMGPEYQRDKEIQVSLVTGEHSNVIKTRARKALEQQSVRTRQKAEVFTPLWICAKMNDYVDEVWFDRKDVFMTDGNPAELVVFPEGKDWKQYVDSRRLEITCGEAPYLVSRYDVSSGESIPIKQRIGILDRKLRVINENTEAEEEWLIWTLRAFQATYGYEFQGDNVLISRVNLLMTFEEYLFDRWKRKPTKKEYATFINVITWNIWQMDGLTAAVPYCKAEDDEIQISMFDIPATEEDTPKTQSRCRIMNWRRDRSLEFADLPARGNQRMKFDYIIGNPPYQDETVGDQKTFAPPIYNLFIEEAYKVSDRVELIHPARFLFNAGSTPKAWNKKMLADPNLKIVYHEQNSANVFPNTDIKGGIVITYHDKGKNYGAIETYTAFKELNSILYKVTNNDVFSSFSSIAYSRTAYRLTDSMHQEHPEAVRMLSKGHLFDMSTNIFELLPQLFFDSEPKDGNDYIQIFGRENGERTHKYIRKDYVNSPVNLYQFKIFVPKANGSGALGEVLTTPVIGLPVIGHTESFISIGCFDTEGEAQACYKYICTKFARCMLGILKVTQDNPPDKWKYVPLQDFTPSSDIDWSKSVAEIDQQLYAKYGLDDAEIEFIESHVKEMK